MLSWEFPPRIIGGISTHVYHLSKSLVRKGNTVHVLTFDFPNTQLEEVVEGVRISRVDSTSVSQTDFLLWIYSMNSLMIERGKGLLRDQMFDLVHAHDWMVGRAALELNKSSGIPLVTTVHATEIGRRAGLYNDYQRTIHEIEQLLIQYSEQVICCSQYMLRHMKVNFGVSPNRISVVPNAVDISRFNSETNDGRELGQKLGLGARTTERVVLYVGRLVEEKGLHTLIEAFEMLNQDNVGATLIIAGEGPIKEDLAAEVRKRGLDEVIHIVGFVDEATLIALYRLSKIFVLPSVYEPFGIAVLEAMAGRLPVVVSDVGGLSEIVEHGVTGLKVQPRDPASLAFSIRRLLEQRPLARELTQNAYRMVAERYDWDLAAERTLQVYERASSEMLRFGTVPDESFLTETSLANLLFTLGATNSKNAKSAGEIAKVVKAPVLPLKMILGRLSSHGYLVNLLDPESDEVRYHLSDKGIIKACASFS